MEGVILIRGIILHNETLFLLEIPVWIIVRIVFLIVTKRNRERLSVKKELVLGVFVIYILSLMGVTLFPIRFDFINYPEFHYISVNIIPFREILRQILGMQYSGFSFAFSMELLIRNVGGNLILLMPIGMFLPALWEKFRHFKGCVIFGVLTSVSIEILQLIENIMGVGMGRVTDIDDVILNTIGVVAGFLTFKLLYRLYRVYKNKKSIVTDVG